jgi:hypothetical protein
VALSIAAQLLPNRALVHGKIIRPVEEWRSLTCVYCTSEALLMNTSTYICMSEWREEQAFSPSVCWSCVLSAAHNMLIVVPPAEYQGRARFNIGC